MIGAAFVFTPRIGKCKFSYPSLKFRILFSHYSECRSFPNPLSSPFKLAIDNAIKGYSWPATHWSCPYSQLPVRGVCRRVMVCLPRNAPLHLLAALRVSHSWPRSKAYMDRVRPSRIRVVHMHSPKGFYCRQPNPCRPRRPIAGEISPSPSFRTSRGRELQPLCQDWLRS